MLNTVYKTMTVLPSQTVSISSYGVKEKVLQSNQDKSFFIVSISDKGKNKEENQDNLLIKHGETSLGHCALLAVADGIGGLNNGEAASKAVIDKLREWWNTTLKTIAFRSEGNIEHLINESLTATINIINSDIHEQGITSGIQMGTTLSLLFIMNNWYCIKHAGDSRVYLYANKLVQLTEDDNLLNQYIKSGVAYDEIDKCSSYFNIITNCIGIKHPIDIFEQAGRLTEHCSFVLCTDGLYKRISQLEIGNGLKKCRFDISSTAEFMELMIKKARQRGEADDISAIVLCRNKERKGFWKKATGLIWR